jgi:hypothetical protein
MAETAEAAATEILHPRQLHVRNALKLVAN